MTRRHIMRATVCALVLALACVPLNAAADGTPVDALADEPAFAAPLYVEANTDAAVAERRLRSAGQMVQADRIRQIASQPTAVWLGDWWSEALMRSVIRRHVAAASAQGASLVFVTYAVPNRDCGGHSAGGTEYSEYLAWNRVVAEELTGTSAVVLVEPDSLSLLSSAKCAGEAELRLPLISQAVDILDAAGLTVYLDGGNSRWLTPAVQADWLKRAGIARAEGFYTNVSNFVATQLEADYAGKVSSRVGWKHYVIDVSRNGPGWQGGWCNPAGAALGVNPKIADGTTKLDALLWVKHPGASDGPCNGGPAAGAWFESYALSLVTNRR